VREVLPALLLMAVTDSLTFRATESHDKRSVGLVEGGERGLARLVPNGGQLVQDICLQGLLL
jgi:hypothetical protein